MGIPYFFIKSLAKTLLPSIAAAALLGPKALIPFSSNLSTAPRAKGSSGATTARSILFSTANFVMPPISVAGISTHCACWDMPPLPGAQYTSFTILLCLIFHTRACSLPPPPTTNTFTIQYLRILMLKMSHFCKYHGYTKFIGLFYGQVIP